MHLDYLSEICRFKICLFSCFLFAITFVPEAGPLCSINATNTTEVDDSNPAVLGCSSSYTTTPSLEPQLIWSNQQNPLSSSKTSTYADSYVVVANPIPMIPSDTCTLSFNAPLNPSNGSATNAPTYTASCETPVIYPFYCPVDISISQSGNTLTCSAQSNPPASYQWYGPTSGAVISNTSKVTVEANDFGNYVCVATNSAVNCSSSSNFTIDSGSTLEWWAWLLIGLGIAATIGTIIFFVWRSKQRVPVPVPAPVPAPAPVPVTVSVPASTPEGIASESKDTDNKLTEQRNEPTSDIKNNESKFETTKSSESSPSDDGKIRPT